MANSSEAHPISQLEENLQCSICLEPLKDPRTLPCFHSFCKVCLEGVVKTCRDKAPHDRPIREFDCPNCRSKFTLDPEKQVADMPPNHFICNMVEATAVLDRGTVPCSHNCSKSFSVARCVTCEKFLCRQCLTGHDNYRANDGHSVLTMEELSKPENRTKIKGKMYCKEHPGMELKVYCETCDKLICRDCMDFKHLKQNHSCLLVKDVANNYKELLASNNKAMEKALTEGDDFLNYLSMRTERLDRDVENVKIQIVEKKDAVLKNVTERLHQKSTELFKEAEDTHRGGRTILDTQTEETKLYVDNIKRTVQLSKKLVEEGTEEEIISSQKMMLDNGKTILEKRQEYFQVPKPVISLNNTQCTKKKSLDEEMAVALEDSLKEIRGKNIYKGQDLLSGADQSTAVPSKTD